MTELVTDLELAADLGVSRSAIAKWTKEGYLHRVVNSPRNSRWDLDQARIWFEQVGKLRRNVGGTVDRNPTGALVEILQEECEAGGYNLDDLTVLSKYDPFRIGSAKHHETGKWLRKVYDLLASGRKIHLRGLFYRMVAAGDVYKPDGQLFINNFKHWTWLIESAAKWARWLGYIPFDWLIDEHNDAPISFIPEMVDEPYGEITNDDSSISIPGDRDDLLPRPQAGYFAARQPWRIVIVGEKSSLADVLVPIARRVGAEIQLFTGTSTITGATSIAERIIQDGRPAVVLYFADFDPSGWHMPIIFSRQIQAYLRLQGADITVVVKRVGLTMQQCIDNALPTTPLKPTELRAARWVERWGREQTEIDALAALKPDILKRIADDAVALFYDDGFEYTCNRGRERLGS
jgi:hypothetical protein